MMIRQKMHIKFALKRVQWIDYLKHVITSNYTQNEQNILLDVLKTLSKKHMVKSSISDLGHHIMNGDINVVAILSQLELVNLQFDQGKLDAILTDLGDQYIKYITKDGRITRVTTSKVWLLKFIIDSKAYRQFTSSFDYMKQMINDDMFHVKSNNYQSNTQGSSTANNIRDQINAVRHLSEQKYQLELDSMKSASESLNSERDQQIVLHMESERQQMINEDHMRMIQTKSRMLHHMVRNIRAPKSTDSDDDY